MWKLDSAPRLSRAPGVGPLRVRGKSSHHHSNTVEDNDEDVGTCTRARCWTSSVISHCNRACASSMTCLRATSTGLRSAGCWSGLTVRNLSTGITSSLLPIAAHRYLWCADRQRARKERRKRATLKERQCASAREREREREKEWILSSAPLRTEICVPALNRTSGPYVGHVLHSHTIEPGRCSMCKYALYCCSLTAGTSGSASLVLRPRSCSWG